MTISQSITPKSIAKHVQPLSLKTDGRTSGYATSRQETSHQPSQRSRVVYSTQTVTTKELERFVAQADRALDIFMQKTKGDTRRKVGIALITHFPLVKIGNETVKRSRTDIAQAIALDSLSDEEKQSPTLKEAAMTGCHLARRALKQAYAELYTAK